MRRGRLHELVDQVNTKAHGRKPTSSRYVGLEHIEPGARSLTSTAPSSVSESTNGVFEKGDVLFGKLRPNLRKAVQVDFGGYCSTDLLVLRPRTGVDTRYAGHVVSSEFVFRHAERNSIGTGMPRTSWHAVSQASIWAPPLEEQRRIAQILDTIDETIQATERVIAKRKRIGAGLAIDLVEGRLGDAHLTAWSSIEMLDCGYPSQLPPATRLGKRETCQLADVADSIVDGPFGSALKTTHYVQDPGVRVVRLANLGDGRYIDDDEAFIDGDYANVLSRHDVRSGDVLVASLGDDNHRSGRACLYPVELAPGIVKADCFRVRPSNSVDSRFLMEILNSKSAAAQVHELAQGVTRDRVNLRHLRRIVLQVPPLREQRRIAEILDSIDEAVQANEGRLDKLRRLRSGLAADLLSGRVRMVAG